MERVPAWIYAREDKISLFKVIKKINNNELRGEVVEENGKKVQYVIVENDKNSPLNPKDNTNIAQENSNISNSEYKKLYLEIEKLRLEIEQMKQMLKESIKKRD